MLNTQIQTLFNTFNATKLIFMLFIKSFILALCLCFSTIGYSQIRLPKLVNNGMILQRNTPLKIWGWAAADEKITLKFNKKQYKTTAGKTGNWVIKLAPQVAGGPYKMTFIASNKIVLNNILFGDVWLCSGQSNMQLTMNWFANKYPTIIKTANNPKIRQFTVPVAYNLMQPENDFKTGEWLAVSPKNILKFSATAYFFVADIYKTYKIPIGLITSAVGGSAVQSWMSEETLKTFPEYYNEAQSFKDIRMVAQTDSASQTKEKNWHTLLNQTDEGLKNQYFTKNLNDNNWQDFKIPGYWPYTVDSLKNGSAWFRKTFEIKKFTNLKTATLLLGNVADVDSVFINGQFVATTDNPFVARNYTLPASVLNEGSNTIAIRVINYRNNGGFVPNKPYVLTIGENSIDLTGNWKYKITSQMPELPWKKNVAYVPSGFYNAMIAPLKNFPIKGVIWYQGEANAAYASNYASLIKNLIANWRNLLNQPKLPFLYVQLPGFMDTKTLPSESGWAELRQQQLKTLSIPNTAMAIAIDLGEFNDIHPLNKLDVGKRLALQAKKLVYGNKKLISSGPLFKNVFLKNNKLVVSFTNIGTGLVAFKSPSLAYFAIAGADKKFVWAKAIIKNNQVIVWADGILKPVWVRYAWADNPEDANLYNKEKMPASPFEAKVKN